jgi:hypothetical protein
MAANEFYIYVLFRETGVPFYVGKGMGDRWRESGYQGNRNRHKERIIRKMQATGCGIPSIILHENLTEDVAFAYEKALIAAIGRWDKGLGPLANQTDGGDGASGWIATAEHRAAMSASRIGRKMPPMSAQQRAQIAAFQSNRSPEHVAKLVAAQQNRSPEWRAKLSASKKGKPLPPEVIAKSAAARRGVKRSAETRAKQSAALKGKNRRPCPPQTRAAVSAIWKGKKRGPMSAEQRAKISAARIALFRRTKQAIFNDLRQQRIPGI